jgi:hypothetical protein
MREFVHVMVGCALAIGCAGAADVTPPANQRQAAAASTQHGRGRLIALRRPGGVPQTAHADALRPGVAAVHPLPIRRLGVSNPATAMTRSAVVGGPRTQQRGTLGGPVNSRSSIRGAVVQSGISGTALRRRF